MPVKLDNKYPFANGGANSKSFLQSFFVSQTLYCLQDRNSDWVFWLSPFQSSQTYFQLCLWNPDIHFPNYFINYWVYHKIILHCFALKTAYTFNHNELKQCPFPGLTTAVPRSSVVEFWCLLAFCFPPGTSFTKLEVSLCR